MSGFKSGLVHLELGVNYPTFLSFNDMGVVYSVFWVKDNAFCREHDLPNIIDYHSNNRIERLSWFVNSGYHRVTGPAVIEYDENGVIVSESYWLDQSELTRDEWLNDSRVIRYFKNHSNGNLTSDVSL